MLTTTDGHELFERARDRFAQAAKEPQDEEPQRKRHLPDIGGRQSLTLPGEGGCSATAATCMKVSGTGDRND